MKKKEGTVMLSWERREEEQERGEQLSSKNSRNIEARVRREDRRGEAGRCPPSTVHQK